MGDFKITITITQDKIIYKDNIGAFIEMNNTKKNLEQVTNYASKMYEETNEPH